jgi:hypothetical protein
MSRATTTRRAIPVVLAVAALALPAGVGARQQQSDTTSTSPQTFFRDLLLGDSATSTAVKRLLRTGAGFVSPQPGFADLTGDGKSDAVVTVSNGGAAGAVAVYVFSAEGSTDAKLHAVYRNQQLYRVHPRVNGSTLTLVVPQWSTGDDLCCPAKLVERDYAWSSRAQAFTRRAVREIPGPGAPTPAPALDAPAA